MNKSSGMTLVELLASLAVGSILVAATVAYSLPMISKESGRSAAYDLQSYAQLARIEALSRNRECRFFVHLKNREVLVVDTMGTALLTDDEVLHDTTLSSDIVFEAPGGGDPITMQQIGGDTSPWFYAGFGPDGAVVQGAGDLVVRAGEDYTRVSVHAAGGSQVGFWNGSTWQCH